MARFFARASAARWKTLWRALVMSRIFLSHSSKDNFEAVAIRDWLKGEGFDEIFLDLDPETGIMAGERWERALHEAAFRCEAVVFLVSSNWLASGWCLKEYALARGKSKKLFAVVIDNKIGLDSLPPELAGTWQAIDLTRGDPTHTIRARLPDSAEERHITFGEAALTRLRNGLAKAGLDPKFFAWPPANDPARPPYPGLKALEADDAGIFFGRDAPIVEAMDRMRELAAGAPPRILVLLGASGAGKSSFLRAGLLPRLERDDAHFLPLKALRPERAPLTGDQGLLGALVAALPGVTRASLRQLALGPVEELRRRLKELAEAARRRTLSEEDAGKPPAIVIAVDQAEELFIAENLQEGQALLALLAELARGDDPAVIALFCVRSDSYDALQAAKPLEGMAQSALSLLPMPRGAYASVIEGPARRVEAAGGKLRIDPALTERLLGDIERGAGSDALPLLAFTLEQMWADFHQAGELRLEDYEAAGGLAGAIDKAVARAMRRADADHRIPRDKGARETLLRRGLIPWLAGVDPDSKSPRRNIARRSDIPPEAAPLIDLLVEERLLSSDAIIERTATGEDVRVPTIEPAHEALLRQWGLLQGWLKEDFGSLAALEGVKRASAEWDANAKGDGWLAHHGQRLSEAQGLDARPDIAARLDPTDRAYLVKCRAAQDLRLAREAASARRIRVALVAAIAAAIVAGALGGVAWWQRGVAEQKTLEAQAQAKRAELAVSVAVETVNSLIFDVTRKIRDQTGMPVRLVKAILDPVLKLEDQLSVAGETDPALRRSQYLALNEAVDTLLAVNDAAGALAAAEKASALAKSLATQYPSDSGYRRDFGIGLDEIGKVKLQLGDAIGALALFEQALAIFRDPAKDKSNAQAQRDLAVALESRGDAKARLGDLAGALADYQETLGIDRAAIEANATPGSRRDLAISLDKVGDIRSQRNEIAEALAAYEESLGIRRDLALDKTNAQAQRDLTLGLDRLGDEKLQAGDRPGALAAYEESLTIRRELAKDLGNAQAQRDVSVSLDKIGDFKQRGGDRAGALANFEEGLAIARALAADPTDGQAQRDLAIGLNKIGDFKFQGGDYDGALADYSEALAIARALAAAQDNALALRDLTISLEKVGDVEWQKGDRAAALANFEESLAISRGLAADQANAGAQRDLSIGLERVGDIKLQSGDRAGAMAAYEESLAIRRALAADGKNAQAQRDLSVSLNKIGAAKLQGGDPPGALAAYEESLSIDRAQAADKGDALAQSDLTLTLQQYGDAALASGDRAKAIAAYEEALVIARANAQDKTDAQAQRVLASNLDRLGYAKLLSGDAAGALAAYQESLDLRRGLAANAAVGNAMRDLAVSFNKVGDAKLKAGDRAGALASYQQALAIARDLAKDFGNAQAQIDLVITLAKCAAAGGDLKALTIEALAILKDLDAGGRLTDLQKGWIPIMENQLKALESPN